MTTAWTGPLLNPYRSDRFVVHARIDGTDYKLFQVIYRNQDGAIFVNLANYFNQSNGIAAHARLPASGGAPVQVDLAGDPQTARLTRTLVKYSHHYDGYAHFSQTGRTDPARQVHKNAVPLSQARGHLFTLHAKGFRDFRRTSVDHALMTTRDAAQRWPVVFHFVEGDPGEVKFVGGWEPSGEVANEFAWASRAGVVGPVIRAPQPDGRGTRWVLLAPPLGTPSADSVLVLRCALPPYEARGDESRLLLIGGFDPPDVVRDPDRDTTILALKYPAIRWEELQATIASMDLRQDG